MKVNSAKIRSNIQTKSHNSWKEIRFCADNAHRQHPTLLLDTRSSQGLVGNSGYGGKQSEVITGNAEYVKV